MGKLMSEIENIRKTPVPTWISESEYLLNIYKKKVNKKISNTDLGLFISCYIQSKCKKEQITWQMFEEHCAILRDKTNANSYDYVVGIESGGAFVARCLRKDAKYIKVSKYDDNPKFGGKPIIKTPDDLSALRGKNVLLVDDFILTGDTMNNARNHILEVYGAKNVDRAILYTTSTSSELGVEYTGVPFTMIRSPWGFSL
jgi:hypoxanthine phosphoribosyltransferase